MSSNRIPMPKLNNRLRAVSAVGVLVALLAIGIIARTWFDARPTSTETPAATAEVVAAGSNVSSGIEKSAPSALTLHLSKFSVKRTGVVRSVAKESRPQVLNDPDASPKLNGLPQHVRFRFGREQLDDSFVPRQRQMNVLPIAAYRALFSPEDQATFDKMIASLKVLLDERPGTVTEPIAVLPAIDANQVFRAHLGYIDFDGGSCVRFITAYHQDAEPVTDADTFYTCQGLSNDGQYYISFVYPVTSQALPTNARRVTRADMRRLSDDYEAYVNRVESQLNGLSSRGFRPYLSQLDAVAESIRIEP